MLMNQNPELFIDKTFFFSNKHHERHLFASHLPTIHRTVTCPIYILLSQIHQNFSQFILPTALRMESIKSVILDGQKWMRVSGNQQVPCLLTSIKFCPHGLSHHFFFFKIPLRSFCSTSLVEGRYRVYDVGTVGGIQC